MEFKRITKMGNQKIITIPAKCNMNVGDIVKLEKVNEKTNRRQKR